MKKYKKLLWVLLGILAAFLVFALWYRYRYSMEVVEPYEVNSPDVETKILIATQGSDFKDRVTQGIVGYYAPDSIYMRIIDIKDLHGIDPKDFDAVLIMHTWENWKPPRAVKTFVDRTRIYGSRIVVVTTSGEGSYKMEGVDALVGESILENVPVFIERITDRLDPLLAGEP